MKKNKFKQGGGGVFTMVIGAAIGALVLMGLYLVASYIFSCETTNTSDIIDNTEIIPKEDVVLNISVNAFGDLLIHNSVYDAAYRNNTYDFSPQLMDIKEKVIEADYTIGNLEVPLGNKDYSNYPSFRAPAQLANALKDTLDVELLSTASNHTLDKGFNGLSFTLDYLDKVNINHIGSYRTKEEADSILIENINGANVAFLSYTYGTNGYPIPKDHPYAVNLIDTDKIKNDSAKAKELGADFIIAKIHWGTEYQENESGYGKELDELTTSSQRGLAKFIFEETDVNTIIGDHPHVVQNIEQMIVSKDGKTKQGTVIYSLGNFISGQTKKYTDVGIIAKLNIAINKTNPTLSEVKNIEYTPIYVDRNPGHPTKKYRVVDINKAILDYENENDSLISSSEYTALTNYRDYFRKKLEDKSFVIEN